MEDIVPEELWSEVSNTVEEAVNKNIPKKNKCEKAKGLSEESLKIAEERSERQGRKGKILNTEFQRIVGRDKAFLSEKCKEIEEINRMGNGNRMGKPRGFWRKLEITREYFMQGGAWNDKDLMIRKETIRT